MARLPDVTALSRRRTDGQAPVATVRNAGADADALANVGETIGRQAEERARRKGEFEYNAAKAQFLTSKTQLDNSFRDDPEYGTFVDRYSEGINTTLNEVASGITDSRLREQFLQEQSIRVAAGTERINNLAWDKEVDDMQSQVTEQLMGLRDVVINNGDSEVVETALGLVDSAVESGYFTKVQATALKEKWKEESAVGWLESLPPEQRLEALSEPMADNLPEPRRATLRRKAEEELITYRAKDVVDDWVAQDLSEDERVKALENIKDPKLYDEVLRRSNNQLSAAKSAEIDQQTEIFDALYLPLRNGEFTLDQVNREQLEMLTAAQISNLYNAEALATRVEPTRSSPDLIWELQTLSANKDYKGMKKLLLERSSELSAADFEQYSKVGIDGDAPDDYKSFNMAANRLKTKMLAITGGAPSDEDFAKLHERLADWHTMTYNQTGKLPTDADVEKQIDSMLMERTVPNVYGPVDVDYRVYEMTPEQQVDAALYMKRTAIDQEAVKDAMLIADPNVDPVKFMEAVEYATERRRQAKN